MENAQHRIAFSKLRLSHHCLEIEKDRHKRTVKNHRFCPFCPESVENEEHFLLQCQTYRYLRNKLLFWAERQIANFSHLDSQGKLINLMANPMIVNKTSSHVNRMFQIREFLQKRHKNPT